MNEVFEQGAQQKLVLYTEGNEIIAVRLPLRTGGEYVLRDGYLADLTAVVLENTIRFAWHSLEHRIILSDIHGRRDQVVLSDAMNASQYGGLRLVNREGKLWLFYTAKEPAESVWKGYLFQPEEEEAARELPGVYDKRPVLEIHRLGVWWILEMGLPGKFSYFIWEENGKIVSAREQAVREEQKKIKEQEQQIAYISEQYERLRKITIELQEDGRRMMDYIRQKKSGHPPKKVP